MWERWISINGGAGTAFPCVQWHFNHWYSIEGRWLVNHVKGQSHQAHCHDTVSRLILYCSWVVTGYLYILSNFVVYRTPHLIGPFECEVSAWRRVIGQTPLCGGGAFFSRCVCPLVARVRVSLLLEFVPYRTLVLPGDSG